MGLSSSGGRNLHYELLGGAPNESELAMLFLNTNSVVNKPNELGPQYLISKEMAVLEKTLPRMFVASLRKTLLIVAYLGSESHYFAIFRYCSLNLYMRIIYTFSWKR